MLNKFHNFLQSLCIWIISRSSDSLLELEVQRIEIGMGIYD